MEQKQLTRMVLMKKTKDSVRYCQVYNSKVLIVGIIPPPMGGMSIHIQRLANLLGQQDCIVSLWDVCKQQSGINQIWYYWSLWRFCLKFKPLWIMYHTINMRGTPLELLILWLASCWIGAKVSVTVHSVRFLENKNKIYCLTLGWLLRRATQVILVSPLLQASFSQKRIRLTNNILIQDPFLPPDITQREQILTQLPPSCQLFIDNHKPLVIVTVTRIATWREKDLYGLDLALGAWKEFLIQFPQAGLLVAIAHLESYQNINLPKSCYLLSNWPHELWPVIAQASLFLRPTRSDGYSISVSEAIYFNIPTIASDICPRPKGTILFKSDNAQDLSQKMIKCFRPITNPTLPVSQLPIASKQG